MLLFGSASRGTPTWSCASWPTTTVLSSRHQTISKAVARPSFRKDLTRHELHIVPHSAETQWRLVGPAGKAVELKVASRLRCNNGEVAHDWALAGCGLIMKSWVDVALDVRAGRLIRVLHRSGVACESTQVCALFPSNPRLPLRVRLSSSTPWRAGLLALKRSRSAAPRLRDRGEPEAGPRPASCLPVGPATPSIARVGPDVLHGGHPDCCGPRTAGARSRRAVREGDHEVAKLQQPLGREARRKRQVRGSRDAPRS